jgi:WD40 repeat protein
MSDQRVVATGLGNDAFVWDTRSGILLDDPKSGDRLPIGFRAKSVADLWAIEGSDGAYILDLLKGAAVARVPEDNDSGWPHVAATIFSFASSSDLAAVGPTEDGKIHIWRMSSGESVAYVPASPTLKRIEFLPTGDALLMISREGFPISIPLKIDQQLRELCPLVWSELIKERVESRGGAYNFCWATFERAKSGARAQEPAPWILRVNPAVPKGATFTGSASEVPKLRGSGQTPLAGPVDAGRKPRDSPP